MICIACTNCVRVASKLNYNSTRRKENKVMSLTFVREANNDNDSFNGAIPFIFIFCLSAHCYANLVVMPQLAEVCWVAVR